MQDNITLPSEPTLTNVIDISNVNQENKNITSNTAGCKKNRNRIIIISIIAAVIIAVVIIVIIVATRKKKR